MPTRYYLDKRQNIFLRFFIRPGERFDFYIGIKVDSKHWSNKTQRVKSSHKLAHKINLLISDLGQFIEEKKIDAKINGELLTSDHLRHELNKRINPAPDHNFYSFGFEYINNKKNVVTAKTYRGLKYRLQKIQKIFPDLSFNSVTMHWRNKFVGVMKDKGYTVNYYYKLLELIIEITREAHIEKLHDNKEYQKKGFRLKPEPVDNLFLTIDQLAQLYFHKYDADHLRNAVNLFIIGAFTGQRVGTFKSIRKSNIIVRDGMELISLRSNKTNHRVAIPLHPILKDCLDQDIHTISDQKLNDYIKTAAEKAGLNHKVRLNNKDYLFCDKISSHTARRSCVSNMLLAGIDRTMIMKLVGWSSEREFAKYDKITKEMAAAKLGKHEFYKK